MKRRVYDALNVLIAANVLRKMGKTVYCDSSIEIPSKLPYSKSNFLDDAKQRIYNKNEKEKLAKIIVNKI